MGRTIPSFRQAVWQEYEEWKPFRRALDKADRKLFDQMWDITSIYNSAMSYAANPVRIHPIMMSIIFHHYLQLQDLEKSMAEIQDQQQKNALKSEEY